jgi:hypothetical protein
MFFFFLKGPNILLMHFLYCGRPNSMTIQNYKEIKTEFCSF